MEQLETNGLILLHDNESTKEDLEWRKDLLLSTSEALQENGADFIPIV